MRVLLLSCVVLTGCVGVAGGEGLDAGPDALAPDAGADAGTSQPVVDAGLDAGGSQPMPDAGGTSGPTDGGFSTNRGEFFGAPRCATAGVTFCDDFEGRAVGGGPDTASWTTSFWNPGTAQVKVIGEGARGSRAMRFQIGTGGNKAMMTLKRVFPMPNNSFWARLFLRLNNRPLPFKWNDQSNFPLTHWTFAYASGNHVFAGNNTLRPELRAGGYINRVPLMNVDGMDRAEMGIDDANPPAGQEEIPENEWICFELYWGGPTQEMRFFQDGLEHPGLHLTTTHTGDNGANPPWPMGEPFDELTVGLVMYQTYDKVGPTLSLDLDEIAVDGQRIGCSR
ncbi:MAG: hypothetical protein ACOZQL_04920 [Myxococcota bacterium]